MEINYLYGSPELLWKASLHKVYLLWGEEDLAKDEALMALTTHLIDEESRDFDLEKLDAGDVSPETILGAAAQMPFSSERRMVVVQGMEQWRARNRQSDADRLAEGIGKLPANGCLVLITASEEEEARRKIAVTKSLDSAVNTNGAIVLCRPLKGEALIGWISRQFEQSGRQIHRAGAELLVANAGTEAMTLLQEIRKLIAYTEGRTTVNADDVGTVVATAPDDVIFATVEAITKRDADRSLTLLAELNRYDPRTQAVAGRLISLLARQYRMVWQAKYLVERRISPRDVRALPPELTSDLPVEGNIAQLAFKASELFNISKSWTWAALSRAMEQLLLCDLANKGGVTEETTLFGSDPAANLQLLVLELTSGNFGGTFHEA